MKLIPDWRRSWRLASVRVAAIGAIGATVAAAAPDMLLQVWQALPEEVRAHAPDYLSRWITPALFAATLAARILKQRSSIDDE